MTNLINTPVDNPAPPVMNAAGGSHPFHAASVLKELRRLHNSYRQTLDPHSVEALERVLVDVQGEWGQSEQNDHYLLETVVVAIAIIFPGVAGAFPLHRLFEDLNLEVAAAWAL